MTPTVLFTAFEPSGDALAAAVITRLQSLRPDWSIHGWGGPRMAAAGAEVHEDTVSHAAMGLGAIAHLQRIRAHHRSILEWVARHPPSIHLPVDSPAANFPLCKRMRPRGVKVVHLAAPQLWAWAPWRAAKLRRSTDLVLCLLPFEPAWFAQRGIPARFVGHPAISRPLDAGALDVAARRLPGGDPRLLLMPGSRDQELRRNIPLMLDCVEAVRERHPDLAVAITAVDEDKAELIRARLARAGGRIDVTVGNRDGALHWSDVVLAVSGTVTLDIMRHGRPMIGLYRTGPVGWLGSKIILTIKNRLLPNLIAGRRIVPEYVPHWGGHQAISRSLNTLLDSPAIRLTQVGCLQAALQPYAGVDFAESAGDAVVEVVADQ